ncbi:Gmad2 immunoglobulin-like domain-containing protein [Actinotalea sp.]|uniref:Gmad2 immunoglobulin-like domain-containing protein n=1 Tax=Actinotalea sp. TaxID=1872145 RepID=UPI003561F261
MALHLIRSGSTGRGIAGGHRARAALVALAAAATLTLAGCQTGTTEPADAPDETSTAAVSEEPTASAEPSAEATPEEEPSTDSGTTTIEAPAQGATVAGPAVTVSGTGTAFEATLLYSVQDAEGETVAEGYTQAGANGEIGPFAIDLTLDPGDYTVQVWEPGMGEGDASAPAVNLAEVTFTVS